MIRKSWESWVQPYDGNVKNRRDVKKDAVGMLLSAYGVVMTQMDLKLELEELDSITHDIGNTFREVDSLTNYRGMRIIEVN